MPQSKVNAFLSRTIEITKHHLKGVYLCTLDKNLKAKAEFICTVSDEVEEFPNNPLFNHSPISITYQDEKATLQPWDPYRCVLSAAINNKLLHFPIRPDGQVFAIEPSLYTLLHLSNIVGNDGRILAVFQANGDGPPPEVVAKFLQRHRNVTIGYADVSNATFETYERMFSLPHKSMIAFLMGMHNRLGSESAVQRLRERNDGQEITRRIFSFLTTDTSSVDCLVCHHWPPNTSVEAVHQVVLVHLDILGRWKKLGAPQVEPGEQKEQWVIMEMPADHIIVDKPCKSIDDKFARVVSHLKTLPGDRKTGISPKEQVLLEPYFSRKAMLLLKYKTQKDRSQRGTAAKVTATAILGSPMPSGSGSGSGSGKKANGDVKLRPPPGLGPEENEMPARMGGDLSFFSNPPPAKAMGSKMPPHQQSMSQPVSVAPSRPLGPTLGMPGAHEPFPLGAYPMWGSPHPVLAAPPGLELVRPSVLSAAPGFNSENLFQSRPPPQRQQQDFMGSIPATTAPVHANSTPQYVWPGASNAGIPKSSTRPPPMGRGGRPVAPPLLQHSDL